MKRIVFLIIASLLVLGLVLPGCDGGNGVEFEDWITIGVAGPLTFIQGRDHLAGAEMARDEINAAGGITDGTTVWGIKIESCDTNEILDTGGGTGTTALTGIIDKVDFVVGGFRTEAVQVYREVAMDAGKIFFNCGPATKALCDDVATNYTQYKYFFRGTPYNDVFLIANCLKMAGEINARLRAEAGMDSGDPATTVAVIVENAEWCIGFAAALPYYLPMIGLNVTSTQTPDSNATDLTTEINAIIAETGGEPMITFTVLSGPPGKAYGMQQPLLLPHTFSTGINVESQDIDYYHDTGAVYHTGLDTWSVGTANTPKTLDWWDDYMAKTGRYPTYCAATYDSTYALKAAIEDVGLDTDAIIEWLEDLDNAQTGVGSKAGFYPQGAIQLAATTWALNITQVLEIYPDYVPADFNHVVLPPAYGALAGLVCDTDIPYTGLPGQPCWTTTAGPVRHDLIYGVGWATGQGIQWQPVDPEHPEGEWAKYNWWPFYTEGADAVRTDEYGNWNFAYPGCKPLIIPQIWIDYWSV